MVLNRANYSLNRSKLFWVLFLLANSSIISSIWFASMKLVFSRSMFKIAMVGRWKAVSKINFNSLKRRERSFCWTWGRRNGGKNISCRFVGGKNMSYAILMHPFSFFLMRQNLSLVKKRWEVWIFTLGRYISSPTRLTHRYDTWLRPVLS